MSNLINRKTSWNNFVLKSSQYLSELEINENHNSQYVNLTATGAMFNVMVDKINARSRPAQEELGRQLRLLYKNGDSMTDSAAMNINNYDIQKIKGLDTEYFNNQEQRLKRSQSKGVQN